MEFKPLERVEQLDEISTAGDYQIILKHNTTCSISQAVMERLQKDKANLEPVHTIYVLDLLAHRELSNQIAGRFGVPHQSPQLLLIKDGRCTYHEWGFDIRAAATAAAIK